MLVTRKKTGVLVRKPEKADWCSAWGASKLWFANDTDRLSSEAKWGSEAVQEGTNPNKQVSRGK